MALLSPILAQAFYQGDFHGSSLEARGLIQGFGLAGDNANDKTLFNDDKLLGGSLSGRLMLDLRHNRWHWEMHAIQDLSNSDVRTGGSRLSTLTDVNRSDALDWHFAGNNADFVLDRLNVAYSGDQFSLKIGRQPINLAATYYFTPNDFFAPFAAQTFYRTYKPGVDAVRMGWQWSDLSQLTVMAVMNYQSAQTPTGWRATPDWGNTSYLARATTLTGLFQWSLLTAQINHDPIIGFDFQGELFDWLGIRGEGHTRFREPSEGGKDTKLALGLEHRFANSLTIRLEQYYHDHGATSINNYHLQSVSTSNNQFYLGRHYTALGGSYEFSPLLTGNAVWLLNDIDKSSLLALYSAYSLSDESELAVGLNLPIGQQPDRGKLNSEFGSYPRSITVEVRSYF